MILGKKWKFLEKIYEVSLGMGEIEKYKSCIYGKVPGVPRRIYHSLGFLAHKKTLGRT